MKEGLTYIIGLNLVYELTKHFDTNKKPSYILQDALIEKLIISQSRLKFSRGNMIMKKVSKYYV